MSSVFCSVKIHIIRIICMLCCMNIAAQDNARYVDPFIGTDRSDAPTIWGQYGGTYPGAVAPWGMVQLSPETRTIGEKGYFYSDTSVCYFTCMGHNSGYPEGSHGNVQITFGDGTKKKSVEEALPGYYSVLFADTSRVEMTATTRTGMFRYRTGNQRTVVTVSDAGDIRLSGDRTVMTEHGNGLFVFSQPWTNSTVDDHTLTLVFDRLTENELLVKVAFSTVDTDGSRRNMDAENPGWDFDRIREGTYREWNSELDVVGTTGNTNDMTKFYTAMYHAFLIPNIISDVDGRYRGADRQIHNKEGDNEYGRFSTWDSFRSLHPLLCLLKPKRQKDMILSMLHLYDQRGYLPFTPMTGYHSIPVITDSYVKGITGFDTDKAYHAMEKFLSGNEIPRPDTYKYIRDGFLNDSTEESVSATLDYAYNDWTLSVFAENTGHHEDAAMFRKRSFNYRNLFDAETQFLLPRNASGFVRNPGEMGYKEADKWAASWFVPHNVQDLINLSGGDRHFVSHLHEAMRQHVVFDNEPVMHYPYLFSYAGRPDLTCYWVDRIRERCYTSTAGGIPGNDDLGSMSSWFVFSAMGFFPVCPGRPEYVLTTPLFRKIVIRNETTGREMNILAAPEAIHGCFTKIEWNGQAHQQTFITHQQITEGGTLAFISSVSEGNPECFTPPAETTGIPFSDATENGWDRSFRRPSSLTSGTSQFQLKNVRLIKSKTFPHEENHILFTITNTGETGTFPATITDGEQVIAVKKIMVKEGSSVADSIAFRIYHEGMHRLSMGHVQLPVQALVQDGGQTLICNRFAASAVVRKDETIKIHAELQNISGKPVIQTVSLLDGDAVIADWNCNLSPGETICLTENIIPDRTGFHTLNILNKSTVIKVYDHPEASCVLDLDFDHPDERIISDASGFGNHGTIVGSVDWLAHNDGHALQVNTRSMAVFPMTESMDITGGTITLAAWVYPMNEPRGYIDFFTKGDYIVFQTDGGQLSFFAGGWGRGTCSIPLPDNWLNNWHHVAGVCTGSELKIYLDGKLQQSIPIEGDIESTEIPWNLGRNAEMPYSRRFAGMFDSVKIFKDALTDQDIKKLYQMNQSSIINK